MNDADIEMTQLAEASDLAHTGICGLCEDILDPFCPKWAGKLTTMVDDTLVVVTPERYAAGLGPVDRQLPYHVECMRSRGMGNYITS